MDISKYIIPISDIILPDLSMLYDKNLLEEREQAIREFALRQEKKKDFYGPSSKEKEIKE